MLILVNSSDGHDDDYDDTDILVIYAHPISIAMRTTIYTMAPYSTFWYDFWYDTLKHINKITRMQHNIMPNAIYYDIL